LPYITRWESFQNRNPPIISADEVNCRAIAKQAKGDLEGAMADYDKAIALKPAHADAWLNRAKVKQARGDLSGAQNDFNKAAELRPRIANPDKK
jgi:tetratricopeptide (TPR) repeat protein